MKYIAFAAFAALSISNFAMADTVKWTSECEFLKADKRLDPIRDKIPVSLGDEPTPTMLENTMKPTRAEQRALQAWSQDNKSCIEAEFKGLVKQGAIPAPNGKAQQGKLPHDFVLLEQGKISYREYLLRLDASTKQTMEAYNRKKQLEEIQRALTEASKSWPSNSPYWAYYNYSMQVAQDMGDGKISQETADQLIETKRKEVDAQVAALSAPKAITLNCAFHFDGGPDFERPFTINYANGTVNGFKGSFTETEIRWEATGNDGATMRFLLNRNSGTMYASDQKMFVQGRCAPAVKQF
ncbi:MAG TPA: hypothetical protein VF450_25445 [Noviherbaspirillum sp.]